MSQVKIDIYYSNNHFIQLYMGYNKYKEEAKIMFISKFRVDPKSLNKNSVYLLSDGHKMPVIGFGTWQVKDGEEAYNSVREALKAGYIHIDTAEVYRNEESVGRAIKDSGIPREKLFVTTKIWNKHVTYEDAKVAIDASLKRLGLDYVDLFLIHWPNSNIFRPNYEKRNKEVWRALEEAYQEGKIKALGVSNFMPHHLEALLKTAKVKPVINQILISPSDMQEEAVKYNELHNILTTAYSPLGTGKLFSQELLNDLAQKYNKTPAQVALRWSLEHGYNPLPKSVTPSRIKENIDIFDFSLSKEDIIAIDNLKGKAGRASNPDVVDW